MNFNLFGYRNNKPVTREYDIPGNALNAIVDELHETCDLVEVILMEEVIDENPNNM